jgi:tripartite motif-containing protein 71
MRAQQSFCQSCPAKALSLGFVTLSCFFFVNARARADIVYVSDSASNTIMEFNSNGQASVFASGLDDPTGLAFDSNGNLYVANNGNGTIEEFGTNGVGSIFASGLGYLGGLAFDSSGNLYAMVNGTIEKFGTNGVGSVFATTTSTLFGAAGLAFDSSGNLYASVDNFYLGGSIDKFNTNGVSVGSLDLGPVDLPFGLAFDGGGNLYVSESGGIVKFNSAQGNGSAFGSDSGGPRGLAFDSSGNLYAANFYNGTVEEFNSNGTGTVFASGMGQPNGIAVQVPESSTLALLSAGLIALFPLRRRRSRYIERQGSNEPCLVSSR